MAIQYLERAIDYAPSDPAFYSDLGQIYYEMGQYIEAEKQFKQALKFDYSYLRALKGLGYTAQARGNLSEAVYIYLRYLQENKEDGGVLFNLGAALQDSGNYAEALRYYSKAEKLEPKNPVIPENRARALYSMGKIEEAIGSLHQALELNPDNPEAHSFLGLALEALGESSQALSSYEAALERDPKNAKIHLAVGGLLDQMGRYKEAAEHTGLALETFKEKGDEEDLTSAYWNLGWSYYHLDDWANSVQASRNALELNPKLFAARFNLALALLHEGHDKDALDEYQKGVEDLSQPSDLKYWAMDDLEEALRKRPDLPGGQAILGMLGSRYEAMRKRRKRRELPSRGSLA